MIPVNLYLRLQALQPQPTKQYASVESLMGQRARVEYLGGVQGIVSNPIGAAVGQPVFVRSGEIIEIAPDFPFVTIEI